MGSLVHLVFIGQLGPHLAHRSYWSGLTAPTGPWVRGHLVLLALCLLPVAHLGFTGQLDRFKLAYWGWRFLTARGCMTRLPARAHWGWLTGWPLGLLRLPQLPPWALGTEPPWLTGALGRLAH